MTDYGNIVERYRLQLDKALLHFEYSLKKIAQLPTHPDQLDEESLETWESFSSRFSRVVDLFLTKYLRARVLENDPGFRGSVRDFANQGEKLGLLSSADQWMALRELRNIEAHTYEDDLEKFLGLLKKSAPLLRNLRSLIP